MKKKPFALYKKAIKKALIARIGRRYGIEMFNRQRAFYGYWFFCCCSVSGIVNRLVGWHRSDQQWYKRLYKEFCKSEQVVIDSPGGMIGEPRNTSWLPEMNWFGKFHYEPAIYFDKHASVAY